MATERVFLIYELYSQTGKTEPLIQAILDLDSDKESPKIHAIEEVLYQPVQDSADNTKRCLRVEVDATDEDSVIRMLSLFKMIMFNPVLTALGTNPRT